MSKGGEVDQIHECLESFQARSKIADIPEIDVFLISAHQKVPPRPLVSQGLIMRQFKPKCLYIMRNSIGPQIL